MLNRRNFLKYSFFLSALPITLRAYGLNSEETARSRLVILFLRGGLDGLHAFSPVDDPLFSHLRPTLSKSVLTNGIRLKKTGFAAHPSCGFIADLFNKGELNFSPCAGTNDKSRSHFQAQDIFELGTGNIYGDSGFLGRTAQMLNDENSSISFTNETPLGFQGGDAAIVPLSGIDLALPTGTLLDAIQSSHANTNISNAIDQAVVTENVIETAIGMDEGASRSASSANNFSRIAMYMANILKRNPNLSLSFIDLGGWDTHAMQENTLSNALASLNDGLRIFKNQLGDSEWQKTTVIVMSEFGRTIVENGTQGTDHGHGGLFMKMGGSLKGGEMLGDFPGLLPRKLHDKRDLHVLTDWRSLLANTMSNIYGFNNTQLDIIFPGRPNRKK